MTRQFIVDASGTMRVDCVWCGRATHDWTERTFQGHVYVCPCGAMGLFAPPHDFDEAGEELLDLLHLEGEVAQPAVPVGRTGMISMRAYDGADSRRKLGEILAANGHEVLAEETEAVVTFPTGERRTLKSWALWWRPAVAPL
jgi:hypothetical protein